MKILGVTAPMTGSGKTTVTLALLSKLENSISFKIGPDYIDGQLHRMVSGRPTVSIDRWLQGNDYRNIIGRYGAGYSFCVVEGVMGLKDSGSQANLSTSYYFEKLGIPYILVVDISKVAESAFYIAKGFMGKHCIGVILNNYHSESHRASVEREFLKHGTKIIGSIPYNPRNTLPERHLGISLDVNNENIRRIASDVGSYLDMNFVDEMPQYPESKPLVHQSFGGKKLNIYIAKDEAFNFYYETSLSALEAMGELHYFSPLKNEAPENPDLIYFGGGYPELYAKELSSATRSRAATTEYSEQGVPIIAECGGLMYLESSIETSDGKYPLAGVFPGTVKQNGKLTLSYTKLAAKSDSILFKKGDTVYGHEFHYSSIDDPSHKVLSNIIGKGISGEDGLQRGNTFGSYSHFDFSRYYKRLYKSLSST